MKKLFYIVIFLFCVVSATAQRAVALEIQNIPRVPMDSLPPDRAEALLPELTDNTFKTPADAGKFSDPDIYGRNWDTVRLFAYRDMALKDLPETCEIRLIGSLDEYCCPAQGKVISKYGPRGRRDHNGTDIKVEHGDPIYAAFDGIVRHSRWNGGGYGNLVIIRHTNGLETYYGHLSRRSVRAGDIVRAGQVIGHGGKTGRAYGVHLHFEVRYCDQTFDPERLIDFESGNLRFQTFALEKGYFNIRSRAVEGIEAGPDDIDMGSLLAAAETSGGDVSDAIMDSIEKREREEAAKKAAKYHTIRSGDTLGRIAGRYGTTVKELCKLNGISPTAVLKIGKSLRVQ